MWQDLKEIVQLLIKEPSLLTRLKNMLYMISNPCVLQDYNNTIPQDIAIKVTEELLNSNKEYVLNTKYGDILYQGPPLNNSIFGEDFLQITHEINDIDKVNKVVNEVIISPNTVNYDLVSFEENPNDKIITNMIVNMHNPNTLNIVRKMPKSSIKPALIS